MSPAELRLLSEWLDIGAQYFNNPFDPAGARQLSKDGIDRGAGPQRARWSAVAGSLLAPAVSAAREYLQLFVTQPYLELHTGPGRGYPVFNVVARDDSVDVLFRRTDWFKVRTERGVEGWASQADMQKTVLADGSPFTFELGDRAGFTAHRYEMGLFAGAYGGATLVSAYGSVSFNSQLALEGALGQFLGRFSNGGHCGPGAHPRDRARVALVAVPDAGTRGSCTPSRRRPWCSRRSHRGDGLRRRRCTLLPDAALFPARGVQGTLRLHQAQPERGSRRMETGIRILLLTVALTLLPGCASVRNWYHQRAERRAAARADTQPAARQRGRRGRRTPAARHRAGGCAPPDQGAAHPQLATSRWASITACCRSRTSAPTRFTASPPPTTSPRTSSSRASSAARTAGRTSFETLGGNIQLLTESERRFTYYDLSLGYNFLPGEAFIGRGVAMTSALYLIGGIGGTDFAGDTKFTVNFGAGYRAGADGLAGGPHHGAGSCLPDEPAGFHQAHQQHRGAHRYDRLLLEGLTMKNRIAALAAALAVAVPALAGT